MSIYESIKSFRFSSKANSIAEGLDIQEQEAPSVSVNLPLNAGLSFNFVKDPDMKETSGEFTDFDDLDDTVKADPFSDSIVPNPEDPDAEEVKIEDEVNPEDEDIETVTDSDEARFLTLQDLM